MKIINNYCPFLGVDCEKSFSSEEELRAFLAYPSQDRISGYMQSLLGCSELKGIDIFSWTKLGSSAGIIFCKICEQIKESYSFIGEITYLNQNVLFELGFAIAQKKLPILIKENNRKGAFLNVLKDITHIKYSDIHELANKLSEAVFEDKPFWGVVPDTNEDVISFITAQANLPVKREIFKRIEDFARATECKTFVDDPSEIPSGHELAILFRKIQESNIIVFHMVGTEYKNYNEINAYVALLSGYALGERKKMLILQEKPSDKMIDLQQIRKEYQDSKTALKILDTFLEPIKNKRKEQIEIKVKQKKYKRIEIGSPAAEYDINIDNYFIETQEFKDLRRRKKFLLLGRRGVGKTANFFQLNKEFSENKNNIVVPISPVRLQLSSIVEGIYKQAGEVGSRALFEMFWRYLILMEIAVAAIKYNKQDGSYFTEKIFDSIEKVTEGQVNFDAEFDLRFTTLMEEFSKKIYDNKDTNVRSVILQHFYKDLFPKLKKMILELSKHYPIIILIDNLDKDWSFSGMESMALLITALFDVMNEINVFNEFGNCRIITFLRTDIYALSSKYDPDFDKRRPSTIVWGKDTLKEMIAERIANSKGDWSSDKDKLWESVFKKDLNGIGDTFDYIVERTIYRPRDILTFCTEILENVNKNGKGMVDERIMREAERKYSRYLLGSLRQEFSVGYPDIDEICINLFMNKSPVFDENQLKRRIIDSAYKPPVYYGIDGIIKFCYETSMIGITFGGKTFFNYEDENWEYSKLIGRARKEKDFNFILHYGLRDFLEAKE